MMILGLLAIAAVVVLLALSDPAGRIGGAIQADRFAGLAWGVGILTLMIAGFWRRFGSAPGTHLRALAVWIGLGLACIVGYAHRGEIGDVGARVMGDLRPGSAVPGPGGTVTITRRSDGAFHVDALVNGRHQSFAFDTGASSVVLTAETAAALGIRPAESEFSVRVSTANGIAYAAPVDLDSVGVGSITERRVPAMVAQPGALSDNLLGQSFLARLPGYEVRGERLILHGR